ncbi:hypothetical protein ACLB1G_20675 [Oxalobacteraceae bacterium A2-2]
MDTLNPGPELRTGAAGAGDHSRRILSSLEHGGAPATVARRPMRWQLDGWTVALMLMLAALSVLVWMTRDGQITPRRYGTSSTSSSYGGYRSSSAGHAPTIPTREVVAEEQQQAATIVNEAISAMPPRGGEQHTLQYPPPHQALRTGPQQTQHPAPSLAAAAQAGAARSPPQGGAMADAKPVPAARKAAPSAPTQAASAPADTDVALLAALVDHAGKPSKTVPERTRDVVERQEGDSTASLLARCRQLGLIESLLCRSRICSGRWENDAACRAAN